MNHLQILRAVFIPCEKWLINATQKLFDLFNEMEKCANNNYNQYGLHVKYT